MKTYTCTECGTDLNRAEAVLRGNAIDAVPTAWCRADAVAAGILTLPMPAIAPSVPAPRRSLAARLSNVSGRR